MEFNDFKQSSENLHASSALQVKLMAGPLLATKLRSFTQYRKHCQQVMLRNTVPQYCLQNVHRKL